MNAVSTTKNVNPNNGSVGAPGVTNPDTYAQAIIAEGQLNREGPEQALNHPIMTPRGIMIALATALVESNLQMYANQSDPESLNYPHDAIGKDENSDGLFQQRPPWWGTVADRMDPARSAALFYHALGRFDYNSTAHPPGWYAQQVQGSAYPDRYDQRFAEATRLYTRLVGQPGCIGRPDFNEYHKWSPNYQPRSGRKVDLWLIHTEQGNHNADGLASWLDTAASGVSYHYTISEDPNDHGVTVCDVVDTDFASWSVLAANPESINLCFAGSWAEWTRQQWLDKAGKAIDVAAYLAVQDCQKYNIPIKVIEPPYASNPPGISDHRYVTQHLRFGNHTDVGDNFPWDVFEAAVNKYAGIAVAAPAPATPPPSAAPPLPAAPPDFAYLTGAVADLVKRVAALEQSPAPARAKAAVKKPVVKRTKSRSSATV
jgi:N-acetyl-anhydromuramyl-L-alanine amidase AmpD